MNFLCDTHTRQLDMVMGLKRIQTQKKFSQFHSYIILNLFTLTFQFLWNNHITTRNKAKLPEQTCEYVSWIVQANSQILGRCNSWECLGQTNLGPVNASPSEGSNSDKNIFHCMLSELWYLIRFVWSHLVCCIQSGLLHLIWIVGSYPDCCILSSLLYLIWIAVSYPDCWMLSE